MGPANVKGIEINPYAAELARVSVWIGEIQWMRRNGFAEERDPIVLSGPAGSTYGLHEMAIPVWPLIAGGLVVWAVKRWLQADREQAERETRPPPSGR